MKNSIVVETSKTINAASSKVWKALTTPSLIKKYLMDTEVSTDWKEGSPVIYRGEYNGKKYEDKGVIVKIEPRKLLQTTYWSSMAGKEDTPENYNLLTYELVESDGKTQVRLTQDNVLSEKEKSHLLDNWNSVLEKLKEVAEGL
jgi:uncharacterized protein YndB with AHSA1/START domain